MGHTQNKFDAQIEYQKYSRIGSFCHRKQYRTHKTTLEPHPFLPILHYFYVKIPSKLGRSLDWYFHGFCYFQIGSFFLIGNPQHGRLHRSYGIAVQPAWPGTGSLFRWALNFKNPKNLFFLQRSFFLINLRHFCFFWWKIV